MSDYVVVPEDRAGLELDEFLCLLFPRLNKGFVRRSVRDGAILVDGRTVQPSHRLRTDEVLTIDFEGMEDAPAAPVAPAEPIPILFEDDDVMIVDKPAGLAVEPERWARDRATLSGALLQLAEHRSGRDGEEGPSRPLRYRLRLVHRIDKDTTGAVIVAKNIETERFLRKSFDAGDVAKAYLALVEGEHALADGESEVIDLPLGPDRRRSGRQMVRTSGGKASRTRVSVARRFRGFTLMRCEPLTGRTHQIRVHLAASGFPLVVDSLYGRRDALFLSEIKPDYRAKRGRSERPLIDRLTLHAESVELPSRTGGRRRVEAPLPKDFERTLKQLEKVRRARG